MCWIITLLLFIHITHAYGIIRISKIFPTCKPSLNSFIHVVCCFMIIFLIKCIVYVDHIKYFVVNDNPRDGIEKDNLLLGYLTRMRKVSILLILEDLVNTERGG